MNAWLARNPDLVLLVAAAALGAVLVLLVVLVITGIRLRRLTVGRGDREWERIDRELALAEQAGRLRIIRELQEVAISQLGRLISQAEGAGYAAERDPQAAVRAAAALAERGRGIVGDLRRVVTVVREGEAVAAPQPGLQSARDLFGIMREAGLVVAFTETGERFPLGQGAELAVFRILQRALENALRHGGDGTTVTVLFSWSRDGLRVQVDDDGIRSAARRGGAVDDELDRITRYGVEDDLRSLTELPDGAGLTDMRQRAELYGGVFEARAVPGVGFSIAAVFPTLKHHNGVHGVDLGR